MNGWKSATPAVFGEVNRGRRYDLLDTRLLLMPDGLGEMPAGPAVPAAALMIKRLHGGDADRHEDNCQ